MSTNTNFFVKKNTSFLVTLPISTEDEENPQIILVDGGIEEYAKKLKEIPEGLIEYHWMKFRKPDWGMDCFLRELAYDGRDMRERTFSQEKLTEARLKYLLLGSSFFPETDKIGFTKDGSHEVLSTSSYELIKQVDPFILRIFLAIASRVWDFGTPAKNLLTKEDYEMLRNDPDGLRKVSELKGLISKSKEEEDKKKSLKIDSEKAASQSPKAESPTG